MRRGPAPPGAAPRILAIGAVVGLLLLSLTAAPWQPAAASTTSPAAGSSATDGSCPDRTAAQPGAAPVLAHFYIWFNATSWNRAKIDYPLAGRYSSDQADVMATQVEQAKAAGIDGFIVGWSGSDHLDARLATLRGIAANNGFKLAITYQAQDFQRHRLPVAKVRKDLETLADTYADDPVFHVLGPRPVVALSGTWNYSLDELRSITAPVASRLLVLATEKAVKDYERVAPAVGGELYYWSSADPLTTKGYVQKLLAMANVARQHCGVWIAPVTPGYDARKVGGQRVVDRRDGATLRSSWEGALATVPDAIGIISWNEFSENTYIEPSISFGSKYLDEIRELTASPPPPSKETDSSAPEGAGSFTRAAALFSAAGVAVLLVTVVGMRRRRRMPDRA